MVMQEKKEADDLRRIYGEAAVFSTVGPYTLVHLDNPTPEEVARREADFNPDEFFFDDCPLCLAAKEAGGHIVYDERGSEDEDAPEDDDAGDEALAS